MGQLLTTLFQAHPILVLGLGVTLFFMFIYVIGGGVAAILLLLLALVGVALVRYFNINLQKFVYNSGIQEKVIDAVEGRIEPEPVAEIRFKKQVFNLPGNEYTYTDAKAVCQAYGADLATYDQIEDAYNHGAEWCNYGWSDGQMALFPTQKRTFDTLQTIDGHQNDCGRPGVNGGFMANPALRFGVNCYGHRPKITHEEDNLMKTSPPYPQNEQDLLYQKQVDYWKNHIQNLLVSPFNHDSWGSQGV
jgi:hypothetical protein